MFVGNLSREKQETFLNLAYTMIYADGRLDEMEKWAFDSYKAEIAAGVDISKAHVVDFEKTLAEFDDCTKSEKIGIFYEIYALALVDKSYPNVEKVLVDMMKERFGISEDKMQEMRDVLDAFTIAYRNLKRVVE